MEDNKPKVGQFYWTDLTVDDPVERKEFYKKLFNWQELEVPMRDAEEVYVDYGMGIDANTPAGGICHNRGQNFGIPPQWIPYFYVEDIQKRLDICLEEGGSLVKESKKKDGTYNYVIVKDPQGAIFGMGNM